MATSGTCLFEWGGFAGIPIIYTAVNKINGKMYVGLTKRGLDHRRRSHLAAAKRGHKGKFYSAIRKYGEDAFVFSVIAECQPYKAALAREVELIEALKPEYNSTAGGEGFLGFKQYPEIIKRIAEARRGKPGHWRGKKRPDISIKNRIRLLAKPLRYWQGKTRSQDTKDKISKTKTGVKSTITAAGTAARKFSIRRAIESRKKRVICLYDGRSFDCERAAAKYYGLGAGTVSHVARGKRTSAFGLKFVYEETR